MALTLRGMTTRSVPMRALFDLTRNLTLYASYTDIYSPQAQVNIDNSRLTPAKGTSIEGWTTALPRRRRYSRPSSAASPAMSALSMELTAP